MRLLISSLALGFVAASAPAADAAVCGHGNAHCARHMAHARYHHYHYAHARYHHYHYAYGYPSAGEGAPPPYGPYAYPPAYAYANPPVYNEGPTYGPYPWSWGDRNTLNLLLNAEGDRPFTD
jgi:hypothetical protein